MSAAPNMPAALPRIATDVYPTRYAALDNPGSWAVFAAVDGQYRSCREDAAPMDRSILGACRSYPGEMAVLSLRERNERFPKLWCGAYVVVFGTESGTAFTVDCQYTSADEARRQVNATIRAASLDEAIAAAERWVFGVRGAA